MNQPFVVIKSKVSSHDITMEGKVMDKESRNNRYKNAAQKHRARPPLATQVPTSPLALELNNDVLRIGGRLPQA